MPLKIGMKKKLNSTTSQTDLRLILTNKLATSLRWFGPTQPRLVVDGPANTTMQKMQMVISSLQTVGMWYAAMQHQEISLDNTPSMSNAQLEALMDQVELKRAISLVAEIEY